MRMAIVPVGSGNGLARCAGIPLKPSGAFDVLLHGTPQPTDAFEVNDQFACMLCGIGFDAAVARRFALQKKRGLFTYARLTLQEYLHFKPEQFSIRAGTLALDTAAYMVTVANSNQFGNNVTIAPMASLTDGLLDVVVVKKQPRWMLPVSLLRQVGGGFKMHKSGAVARGQHVVYTQAAGLQLTCTRPMPVHIDGDPAGMHTSLKIKMLPGAFTLWVP
jgi:diacylglycerol kinase family enzyme